jgi:hypothetical protein
METTILSESNLALVKWQPTVIGANNWSKKSLRVCLKSLGISEKEMRFRKGARFILQDWTGEEQGLIDLARRHWKTSVIRFHENGSSPDPVQWMNVNSIFSSIVEKIEGVIRRRPRAKVVEYTCFICKKPVRKKVVSEFQWNSKLCGDPNCKRLYHNYRINKLRRKLRQSYRRICIGPGCNESFLTYNSNQKYHSNRCRMNRNAKYQKSRPKKKKMSWKIWWESQTPEQQDTYLKRHHDGFYHRREHETPEQSKARKAKAAAYARTRHSKMSLEQRRAERYTSPPSSEMIAKKKAGWKDKPWMFETWLQVKKQKFPQMIIPSHV